MENENVTAIILPGENSLLGRTKLKNQIKEEITIRTLHNLLRLFCSNIIISAKCPTIFHFMNEKLVMDETESLGTIGTIISCLNKSSSRKNLIITCDMPLVPAGLLRLLFDKKNEADFVVPASGMETVEPLCAIYDKSVIPALMEMISAGDYNIYNLPQHCKTAYVQVYNGNNIFRKLNTLKHFVEKK